MKVPGRFPVDQYRFSPRSFLLLVNHEFRVSFPYYTQSTTEETVYQEVSAVTESRIHPEVLRDDRHVFSMPDKNLSETLFPEDFRVAYTC